MKSNLVHSDGWLQQQHTPHWYVARTNPRQEALARMSLRAEGFEHYLPMLPDTDRKGALRAHPLFASYVFVRLTLGEEGWTRVFSTRGVAELIANGSRPTPIADLAVHRVRVCEREAFIALGFGEQAPEIPHFELGQEVTIKGGPFNQIKALFEKKLDDERCTVLFKIVGDSPRIARITLALGSIK
jgi:transcriptional antiterminator RfaH